MAKLTFCGGTGTVTGANFLLETETSKILVDCGMVQGSQMAESLIERNFLLSQQKLIFC